MNLIGYWKSDAALDFQSKLPTDDNPSSSLSRSCNDLDKTSNGGSLSLTSPIFPTIHQLRHQNLHGRTLIFAVVNNWPFFGLTEDEEGNLFPESGIDVSVVSYLARAMNFTYVSNKFTFMKMVPTLS